ncbi:Oidioi.mRNA.OKI2018_I69.chr1.g3907.t1.cds [Oikopleura dioica]|uniref:Oidioi.mRNA.OKI2018_I69.chr1.g3907.t1.cds n=1 Tax=Oikopleura dioica TaxID=34765 RepID=A0ABN7SVN4_OIKDI|nr:Oidioi.mRNA.OKI2018_I69.chr1.g3907.t1.cds [Oikopleura dioica]
MKNVDNQKTFEEIAQNVLDNFNGDESRYTYLTPSECRELQNFIDDDWQIKRECSKNPVAFADYMEDWASTENCQKAAAKFPEKDPKQYILTEEECDEAQDFIDNDDYFAEICDTYSEYESFADYAEDYMDGLFPTCDITYCSGAEATKLVRSSIFFFLMMFFLMK